MALKLQSCRTMFSPTFLQIISLTMCPIASCGGPVLKQMIFSIECYASMTREVMLYPCKVQPSLVKSFSHFMLYNSVNLHCFAYIVSQTSDIQRFCMCQFYPSMSMQSGGKKLSQKIFQMEGEQSLVSSPPWFLDEAILQVVFFF